MYRIIFLSLLTVVPASGQWEFGLYLGKGNTAASDLRIVQPSQGTDVTLQKIGYQDRSFESPQYYGMRVGYFFPATTFLGIEVDFIHLKIYADAAQQVIASGNWRTAPLNQTIRVGDIIQGFSISHGVNLLLFNVVLHHALLKDDNVPGGKIRLLGKLGVGPAIPHTESTVDNESQQQYEINGPTLQIAVGGELRIVGGLYWLLEYKFSSTTISDVSIVRGTASTTLRTNHIVSGITVRL